MPKAKSTSSEIIYASPRVVLCTGPKALKVESKAKAPGAKKLIGWQEEQDNEDFGEDFDLRWNGVKIRLTNNFCNDYRNRPFDFSWSKSLAQELLRGRWKFNFENVIIGSRGWVLSGQHRLVALIIAKSLWEEDPEAYPHWSEEPTMETSVAFGAPDGKETVQTFDCVKPSTLADVLFKCEYFTKMSKQDAARCARHAANAVKLVWNQTGVQDAFGLKQTNAEAIDFLDRHKKIVDCVKFISAETEDSKGSLLVGEGYASGYLYLMATSGTDEKGIQAYLDSDSPDEKTLNFDNMETAEQFWTLLLSRAPDMKPAVSLLLGEGRDEDDVVSPEEKLAIISAAYSKFANGNKIVKKAIEPKFTTDGSGYRVLVSDTRVGGIDFGGVREDNVEELEEEEKAPEGEEETTTEAPEASGVPAVV